MNIVLLFDLELFYRGFIFFKTLYLIKKFVSFVSSETIFQNEKNITLLIFFKLLEEL